MIATITEKPDTSKDTIQSADKPQQDISGRDRLISNVLFSWTSHLVFFIAGFIMPRMIDNHLGQELLGVWDLGWSLVGYFYLVQGGVNSSVNRYVARYRAANDMTRVNDTVSSGLCVMGLAGLGMLGLTVGVTMLMPAWFGGRLAGNVREAQWVYFYLGISMVIDTGLGPFTGVLTGCHRWKMHNLIKSGSHMASVAGMIVVLLAGGNLVNLAQAYLVGQVVSYAMRVVCAYRVCPGLHVNPFRARRSTIKSIFAFSGKILIPTLSVILATQTTGVLIVASLGPAALALFTRPQSLTRQISTFVNKLAFVLTPTASSLQSTGNHKEIKALLLKTIGYASHLSLPLVLVLTVFGGPILQLWMGKSYASNLLPAILALGALPQMINMPAWQILVGLNAHGRVGVAQLPASMASVLLIVLVLGVLDLGLVAVAVAGACPRMVVHLFYLPLCVRRRLNIRLGEYATHALLRPMVHVFPFAACLVGARFFLNTHPLAELAWGLTLGGTVLMVIYWRYVLPARLKGRLIRMVPTYHDFE